MPGSHHPQFLDVLHRSHAGVEDKVRTDKAMGLRNLPSQRVPGGVRRRVGGVRRVLGVNSWRFGA